MGGTCQCANHVDISADPLSDLAAERERHRLRAAEDGDLVPTDLVRRELDPAKACEQAGQGGLDLGARQRGTKAEVRAESELKVPVGRAADVEAGWFRELSRVSAGRADGKPEGLTRSDLS